jgi:hypothetical protein
MRQLVQYFEEIRLGEVHNPHTNRREMLTEHVTVCPACRSLRSLRHEGNMVECVDCCWQSPVVDHSRVA